MRSHSNGPHVVAVLCLLLATRLAQAQGTLQWTVTFDGPPLIPPEDEIAISYYSEKGMAFTPIATGQFGRSGGAPLNPAFARNGTAYLVGAFTYSLAASSLSGARFAVVSVELAEFSTLYQTPLTVQFVGYKPDGSTVTTAFVTDGIIDGAGPANDFQTFYFDSRFGDVTRVEVPTYGWSLDNMVFSNAVPEPGTGTLLGLGAALLAVRLLRRKTSW
jgi:hypothetical protein